MSPQKLRCDITPSVLRYSRTVVSPLENKKNYFYSYYKKIDIREWHQLTDEVLLTVNCRNMYGNTTVIDKVIRHACWEKRMYALD